MSDTHSLLHYMKFNVPDGDIFIHCGDFSACGRLEEVIEFNNFLATLPHKHKLVIAGNHELAFDPAFNQSSCASGSKAKNTSSLLDEIPTLSFSREALKKAVSTENIRQYLTNCTYLEDSGIELYGIKFYGTPWQPRYCNWAFNLERGQEILEKWNKIPSDTDILITHTPPLGYCDLTATSVRAGCVDLLTTIQKRVKPKYSIFGHIHESYGVMSDGKTIFINASTCDINYLPNNPPIVFDMPIKK
jgi:predicted phosphohydrolase